MERVDGVETCVDATDCPAGSYPSLRNGKCECPQFSMERTADQDGVHMRFCICPAHSEWVAAD